MDLLYILITHYKDFPASWLVLGICRIWGLPEAVSDQWVDHPKPKDPLKMAKLRTWMVDFYGKWWYMQVDIHTDPIGREELPSSVGAGCFNLPGHTWDMETRTIDMLYEYMSVKRLKYVGSNPLTYWEVIFWLSDYNLFHPSGPPGPGVKRSFITVPYVNDYPTQGTTKKGCSFF